MTTPDWILFGIKFLFATLGVVFILVYLLWPLYKSLRVGLDFFDIGLVDTLPEEEAELQIPTEDDKPGALVMIEQARSDPRRTATVVSQWLRERK